MHMRHVFALLVAIAGVGCSARWVPDQEAWSLDGRPLIRPEIAPDRLARLQSNLAEAQSAYVIDPSEENTIWVGRRRGYLGQFRKAVEVYTEGLNRYPESYRLLRHRGHRWITLRRFDLAARDLERAAALCVNAPDAPEPDGEPQGPPRSTDRSNIFYHLGLAQYLRGRFAAAEQSFAERRAIHPRNDDMLVSETHWRVLALVRLGREAEARRLLEEITPALDVLENGNYHRLCLFYKGELSRDAVLGDGPLEASTAYGVAAWLGAHGQREQADALKRRIIAETNWAAFGHIAAEADLARGR
ncbi:MAG: hypothetical protein HBSAPP03_20970 [Phycisphaerae bacterium]|nr:MAG: hypothetical protein HBSAPP03_20970 [Phycisphaerae bacterium]